MSQQAQTTSSQQQTNPQAQQVFCAQLVDTNTSLYSQPIVTPLPLAQFPPGGQVMMYNGQYVYVPGKCTSLNAHMNCVLMLTLQPSMLLQPMCTLLEWLLFQHQLSLHQINQLLHLSPVLSPRLCPSPGLNLPPLLC
jgi:hypothetical protein